MKFWKFEYDGPVELSKLITARSLPPSKEVPGLSNTYSHPVTSLKSGDGIILAKLDGTTAKIYAVGKVISLTPDRSSITVDWAEVNKALFPNPQGGLTNWKTKTAFEISPDPAKRYGLRELIDRHINLKSTTSNLDHFDIDDAKALEGYLHDRKILAPARNASLASKRKKLDNYTCRACEFKLQIGDRHVIDVHHLNPLGDSGKTITTIDDLICLCPTCHRIAHLRNPPYSVKEIIEIVTCRDSNS